MQKIDNLSTILSKIIYIYYKLINMDGVIKINFKNNFDEDDEKKYNDFIITRTSKDQLCKIVKEYDTKDKKKVDK